MKAIFLLILLDCQKFWRKQLILSNFKKVFFFFFTREKKNLLKISLTKFEDYKPYALRSVLDFVRLYPLSDIVSFNSLSIALGNLMYFNRMNLES